MTTAEVLATAPVLSTPDAHILEASLSIDYAQGASRLSDEQLYITYEIKRTVDDIRAGKWKRIALQFPDHMLIDAPRVYQALARDLKQARKAQPAPERLDIRDSAVDQLSHSIEVLTTREEDVEAEEKLFILADTSYGACCADEVAAEHANADVIVHYGRSCLSPTTRLPVILCFTLPPLDVPCVIRAFKKTYSVLDEKIILMADAPYSSYLPEIEASLKEIGYHRLFTTSVVHNTASPLPNRTVPSDVSDDGQRLTEYKLFHVSEPPPSLLLTLFSRIGAIHVYPTKSKPPPQAQAINSSTMLRRRYALLTSLKTASVFGILINTVSVKNYLPMVEHVKKKLGQAGKKSYTFVVGKVNAAKIANFSEVDGWVVIGCWESSLFESKDFWKPVITPFELELALRSDEDRVWTGKWTSDFQATLDEEEKDQGDPATGSHSNAQTELSQQGPQREDLDADSEEESEPPEFDLRMGRYVSHSRPMPRPSATSRNKDFGNEAASSAGTMIKTAKAEIATIGGVVSPAAEFLRNKRTWQGLGSDFELRYDESGTSAERGTVVEQGRSGIARGYVVGDDEVRS